MILEFPGDSEKAEAMKQYLKEPRTCHRGGDGQCGLKK